MKSDAINLLRVAAERFSREEAHYAFAVYTLANNLRLLMRSEATIEDWNKIYVGADRAPFDIDALLPIEDEGEDEDEPATVEEEI
jgi:hypothetical protein